MAREGETACVEDLWLELDQYQHLELGCLEVTEEMAGSHYDVKFLLHDYPTEHLLDEKTVWRVTTSSSRTP